jgi:hypothetical protein
MNNMQYHVEIGDLDINVLFDMIRFRNTLNYTSLDTELQHHYNALPKNPLSKFLLLSTVKASSLTPQSTTCMRRSPS